MRRLFASLVWNILAGTALAAPGKILLVRGVDVISATSRTAVVETEIECGERLKGILIKEIGGAVGLAAVIERPEVRCSAGPLVKQITLPIFSLKNQEIGSLPIEDEDTKVVLQEARIDATKQGLQVSWEETCRTPMGVIVIPGTSGELGVSLAFQSGGSKRKALACEGGKKSMILSSLNTSALRWQSVSKPGSIERLYAFRVVSPRAVNVTNEGEVTVSWEKRCKEVVIGMLFQGPTKSSIGVVTAFLPNVSCDDKKTIETTTLANLVTASGASFKPLSLEESSELNRDSYGLSLSTIERMEITKTMRNVRITSTSTCDRNLGLVVGSDDAGNLAMATLVQRSPSACSTLSSKTTDALPLRVGGELTPRLFPLKIAGSKAH